MSVLVNGGRKELLLALPRLVRQLLAPQAELSDAERAASLVGASEAPPAAAAPEPTPAAPPKGARPSRSRPAARYPALKLVAAPRPAGLVLTDFEESLRERISVRDWNRFASDHGTSASAPGLEDWVRRKNEESNVLFFKVARRSIFFTEPTGSGRCALRKPNLPRKPCFDHVERLARMQLHRRRGATWEDT